MSIKCFLIVLVLTLAARAALADGVTIAKMTVMSADVEVPVEVAITSSLCRAAMWLFCSLRY